MFKLLRPVVFLVLTWATTMSQPTFAGTVTINGTTCQPANLIQDLSLGLDWSQLGTTNNAP